MQYTKDQHFYPRFLLRNFADENDKVFEYNLLSNTVTYTPYHRLCSHNHTYETEDVRDNHLEKLLKLSEDKTAPIIKQILDAKVENLSEKDISVLWQYVWIQATRTDSGRLMKMEAESDIHYSTRKTPVSFSEIKAKKREIYAFNKKYKNPTEYLELLEMFSSYRGNMVMHVGISKSKEFITSDNPVVAIYAKGNDSPVVIFFPISPFHCLEFIGADVNPSKKILVEFPDQKVRNINFCEIDSANYSIISNSKFDIETAFRIMKRVKQNQK